MSPFTTDFPDTAAMIESPKKASAAYSGDPKPVQILASNGAMVQSSSQLMMDPQPDENVAHPSALAASPFLVMG